MFLLMMQSQTQVGGARDDTTALENATYLGGVAVSEAGEGAGSYLQFVAAPGPGAGQADLGAFSGAGPVYVSPSLYPSSSSPSTTTYYDTAAGLAGAGYTPGTVAISLITSHLCQQEA